jgi:hypothetical protein
MNTAIIHAWGLRALAAASVLAAAIGSGIAAEHDARQELIDNAARQVQRQVEALHARLDKHKPGLFAAWAKHLELDAIGEELGRETPDLVRLKAVWNRFFTPQDGLEQKPFLELRDALERYLVIAATPQGDLRSLQAEEWQKVQAQLAAYRASNSRDDLQGIGRSLAWLELTGADKAELARIRRDFGHQNAYARVSTRVADLFMGGRTINQQEQVSTSFDGATTTGLAVTRGKLSLKTAPSSAGGAIDIRMTGTINVDNSVTQRGRITLYGGAVTNVDALVRLHVEKDQLRADAPVVHCDTHSHIDDINAERRIIERLAWRRAPKEVPDAEQNAARQAEQPIAERLNQEISTMLEKANELYAKKIRLPMTRRGAWPELSYSSDGQHLHMRLLQAESDQLAAPRPLTKIPLDGDLVFCGHESFFENMLDGLFAGREIKDERFLYLLNLLTGEAPRPLWVHDREPRWSVIMADERPLRFQFRDGYMRLTLATQETLRGDERFPMPALISANFNITATDGGPSFQRRGDIEIEFPEREKDSAHAEQLRSFLARKFDAVMPAQLYFDGLAAPAGGFGDKINALRFQEFRFKDGWATWNYVIQDNAKAKTTFVSTKK